MDFSKNCINHDRIAEFVSRILQETKEIRFAKTKNLKINFTSTNKRDLKIVGNFQADILCKHENGLAYIEIENTNPVSKEKIKYCEDNKIPYFVLNIQQEYLKYGISDKLGEIIKEKIAEKGFMQLK